MGTGTWSRIVYSASRTRERDHDEPCGEPRITDMVPVPRELVPLRDLGFHEEFTRQGVSSVERATSTSRYGAEEHHVERDPWCGTIAMAPRVLGGLFQEAQASRVATRAE